METATINEESCFFADPHEGRCFHCGEALPSDPLTHFVKGAPLAFCCQGCLSVCRYIYEAGLDVYYEK
ncbi:MAG: heavy metal translocating P-type ATPase metal-binding domain-containing protein, partial [Deltaproteobacteria bacterium]|nr:heavy metal translocating P-type ATPase metal-binding domain-containing protein [Deltaproteobacteria bacterium]